MNENFEQDQLLAALKKAAKPIRAPKLTDVIFDRIQTKTSRTNFSQAKPRGRFTLAAAAALAVIALGTSTLGYSVSAVHIKLGHSSASKIGTSDTAFGGLTSSTAAYIGQYDYTYIAGIELSTTGATGNVYKVVNDKSPEEMANLLQQYFEFSNVQKMGATLFDDGKQIYVDSYGGTLFSYSNANAYHRGDCIKWGDAKVPIDKWGNPTAETDPTNTNTRYCIENAEYPPNLISNAEAITQAQEVFDALGLHVSKNDIEIQRGTDTVYGAAPMLLNGKPTGMTWQISWGNEGEISSIAGLSAKFENAGSVPTISEAAAVERLQDWRWRVAGDAKLSRGIILSAYKAEPATLTVVEAKSAFGTIQDVNGQRWVVPSVALYSKFGIAGAVTTVAAGVIDMASLDESKDVPKY